MKAAVIIVSALALAGPALAQPCGGPIPRKGATYAGSVRHVFDGDTICVGPGADPQTWVPVRLADFYAPERYEPGGPEATAALTRLTAGPAWLVCTHDHANNRRSVAMCELGGFPLGDLMRGQGVKEGGRGYVAR